MTMAELLPFRALHYDPQAVGGLADVVTQPYDKITGEMQARYYAASPYNLARIIRRRPDADEPDPYVAAAREWRGWIERRIVVPDDAPALYPYHQEYALPGRPGARKRRRGFIALCRLEDYSAGVIYRHEETLAGPKADRLALLQATRAHFGQIFLLYSDAEGAIEQELARCTRQSEPWERVEDEYGARHEVWRLQAAEAIRGIQEAIRQRQLVIADGHHRYETALAYRDSLRAQGLPDAAAEYVMATFVRRETDGLVILPTHRVVHDLRDFDWVRFLAAAGSFFEVTEAPDAAASGDLGRLAEELAQAHQGGPAFWAYAGRGRAALLALRPGAGRAAFPTTPPGLARLDVFILHRLVLERLLGISREAVREERNLRYEREMENALRQVDEGRAQVSFLLHPTPIEAVWENAVAGRVMPQKSTDFYPKLLSGLTIYSLDRLIG
jgi:uncharacterized protein (DUF1015 family)